jgi:hypothetical protein
MLMLDEMRERFANAIAKDPCARWRMDAAFADCIQEAYRRGLADGRSEVGGDITKATSKPHA